LPMAARDTTSIAAVNVSAVDQLIVGFEVSTNCRFWVSTEEQPPCFAQAPVPDPVRGLLTPRLSVLLSAPTSHVRNRSRDAVNRRSERCVDRRLIAPSIHNLDERAADAWISAVLIKREQEGEHRGGTPPPREVFPPRARLARLNRGQ
jgi:hypothetical protein